VRLRFEGALDLRPEDAGTVFKIARIVLASRSL
jgi:hypothetical protein